MRPYSHANLSVWVAVMESRRRRSHSQCSSTESSDAKTFVWIAGRLGFDSLPCHPMSLRQKMATAMLHAFLERAVCPLRTVSKEIWCFPRWMKKTITLKWSQAPSQKNVALWLWSRINPSDQQNAVRHAAAKLLGSLVWKISTHNDLGSKSKIEFVPTKKDLAKIQQNHTACVFGIYTRLSLSLDCLSWQKIPASHEVFVPNVHVLFLVVSFGK